MSAESLSARYCVDAGHRALAGHFPGSPIVPAAVLLRFVELTLARAGQRLTGIELMKFLRPVRPGELIDVTVTPIGGSRGSVEVAVDGGIVARGLWHTSQE